ALGDEVRVTVIAAGFEGGRPKRREEAPGLRRPVSPQKVQTQEETRAAAMAMVEERRNASSPVSHKEPVTVGATPSVNRPSSQSADFADDDLDIPDFLK
ncbi:MAG: cell division protein FtsZ, partial [Marmoricola sp.]